MTTADAGQASSSINATTSFITLSPPPPPLSPPGSAVVLSSNLPLLSAFLAFAIAQFLKLLTTWYKERRWDSKKMIDSGGMPSSHSATVTALAVSIGIQEGTGAASFAIAVVFACVVMYDASGVRFHAGRQAEDIKKWDLTNTEEEFVKLLYISELLNQIVCEFPPDHPLSSSRPLRDSLGHTPLQVVAGALLGCMVSYLLKLS